MTKSHVTLDDRQIKYELSGASAPPVGATTNTTTEVDRHYRLTGYVEGVGLTRVSDRQIERAMELMTGTILHSSSEQVEAIEGGRSLKAKRDAWSRRKCDASAHAPQVLPSVT